jgi:hypothetical protein
VRVADEYQWPDYDRLRHINGIFGPLDGRQKLPRPKASPDYRGYLGFERAGRMCADATSSGMFGGKTPRQAVKTAAGKTKVVEWLKYLE